MSSLHESPPMSASYLKRTVSKAWRQIHFFFSCLCHSCSLRQLGWETNFLAVRKEKKNQKQKHFWTSSFKALLGSGHCVYCRAEWWRLTSSAPAAAGVCPKMCGASAPSRREGDLQRHLSLLQSLDRAIGCLHQLEICPEMEERGNWSKKRAVKKNTHASDCSGKIINI